MQGNNIGSGIFGEILVYLNTDSALTQTWYVKNAHFLWKTKFFAINPGCLKLLILNGVVS